MRKSQRVIALALVGTLGLAAAACGSDKKSSSTTATTVAGSTASTSAGNAGSPGATTGDSTATTTASSTGSGGNAGTLKLGIAFDTGGKGDGTFNDSADRGAQQAKSELGAQVDELEAKSGEDRGPNLTTLSQNGDNPIIAVGFLFQTDLEKIAPANPKTWYGLVDSCTTATIPNVACLLFAAEQGSFLVGAAAALKSKTGHIGFIGGQEIALIKNFESGYDAGAKAVNPNIKIESKYLGAAGDDAAWTSPDKAKEIASGWYGTDVDIIYSAAGGSGAGTIQAAVAANKWAIGVDSDEYNTSTVEGAKQHVLTSMIKRVDQGVFLLAKAVKEGSAKAGPNVFDLAQGGISYSTSGGFVDDIKDKLEGYKADIISGKIKVPTVTS
jgi:basic membrane protein A